jgi:hypothetical protein
MMRSFVGALGITVLASAVLGLIEGEGSMFLLADSEFEFLEAGALTVDRKSAFVNCGEALLLVGTSTAGEAWLLLTKLAFSAGRMTLTTTQINPQPASIIASSDNFQ